jgi:hypothetical protein
MELPRLDPENLAQRLVCAGDLSQLATGRREVQQQGDVLRLLREHTQHQPFGGCEVARAHGLLSRQF